MNLFRNASLTVKLTLSVLLVLAVTLIGSTLFLVRFTSTQMDKKALIDLKQQMLLVINQLQSYNSGLDMTVSSMVAALGNRHVGAITVDAGKLVETGSASVPELRTGRPAKRAAKRSSCGQCCWSAS